MIKRQPREPAAVFAIFSMDGAAIGGCLPRFAVDFYHGTDELFCSSLINWCPEEVDRVPIYLDVLMVLNFLVDFLLLMGTNRLAGYPAGIPRALAAGALGGIYGGICVLPGWTFLAATHWRLVVLGLMAVLAFGFSRDSARRGILFVLLSMALGGVAMGLGRGKFWSLLWAAAAVAAMCIFGFQGKIGSRYLQVKIGDCAFTALIDTGNTLTDPLTGHQILVVSSKIGSRLLSIDPQKLTDPVGVMAEVKGIRLVCFHAVGKSGGLLPVKRYDDVRIGKWKGSLLVGFAPNEIGQGKQYDALTGGVL